MIEFRRLFADNSSSKIVPNLRNNIAGDVRRLIIGEEMEDCGKVPHVTRESQDESHVDGNADKFSCNLMNIGTKSCGIGSDPLVNAKDVGGQSHLLPCKARPHKTAAGSTGKLKRKSRSTRRRLNALTNNSSLHFSDTDSEGELVLINPRAHNVVPATTTGAVGKCSEMPNPTISVTTEDAVDGPGANSGPVDFDPFERSTPNTSRRQSFVENLTDCDEIYSSDSEVLEESTDTPAYSKRKPSLAVINDALQLRETDCEDFSNDEDDGDDGDGNDNWSSRPIYVPIRTDIFADFNGETITTKEGNGPFSVEVRNQLSFDEGAVGPAEGVPADTDFSPTAVAPGTDSEDMDASDEENAVPGARRPEFDDILQDLDVAGTSQIVVRNSNKVEEILHQMLNVGEATVDDGHTDVEDIDNE